MPLGRGLRLVAAVAIYVMFAGLTVWPLLRDMRTHVADDQGDPLSSPIDWLPAKREEPAALTCQRTPAAIISGLSPPAATRL